MKSSQSPREMSEKEITDSKKQSRLFIACVFTLLVVLSILRATGVVNIISFDELVLRKLVDVIVDTCLTILCLGGLAVLVVFGFLRRGTKSGQ